MKTSVTTISRVQYGKLSAGLVTLLLHMLLVQSCNKEGNLVPLLDIIAPDFTLSSLEGDEVSLSDHKNKVIVLFFFGNNCPTCKSIAPSIESKLYTPTKVKAGFQLFGLDQWNGNNAAVEGFENTTKVTFPLLLNASGVAAEYGTTYDRLVVINQEGKIVFSGKQKAASDLEKVIELVNSMLVVSTDSLVTQEPADTSGTPTGNAPDFSLNKLDGGEFMRADLNKKVAVLFFFGYNCPNCKSAAPSIETILVAPFSERTDYILIGLDQWNGQQAAVESFKNTTGVTFPLLLQASSVATAYDVTYDRLVIVDKAGNIVHKGTTGASADVNNVKAKVEVLLSE